jgi:hypothetical protein
VAGRAVAAAMDFRNVRRVVVMVASGILEGAAKSIFYYKIL